MSHADGQISYRVGPPGSPNYRGIDSPNRAEDLARRGMISGIPVDLDGAGLQPDSDNPSMATSSSEKDEAKKAMDAARRSTWKPGMTAPKKAAPDKKKSSEDAGR